MVDQPHARFGKALRQALRDAGWTQARLAEALGTDPAQISRWVTSKTVPHIESVTEMESHLGVELAGAFRESVPEHELYVSAPITGLLDDQLAEHHDNVARVVAVAR